MATFTIRTYDIYNERPATFATIIEEQPYLKVTWYKLQFDSGL